MTRIWSANGGIVSNSNGIVECDDCPCVGCPNDCGGCGDSIEVTLAGFTAGCSCGNTTLTINREGDTCIWSGDGFAACCFGFSTMEANLTCENNRWVLTVTVASFDQLLCDGDAVYIGSLPATGCPPNGPFTLDRQAGSSDCDAQITATLAA